MFVSGRARKRHRGSREEVHMYIGLGTVLLIILIVLLVVYVL